MPLSERQQVIARYILSQGGQVSKLLVIIALLEDLTFFNSYHNNSCSSCSNKPC